MLHATAMLRLPYSAYIVNPSLLVGVVNIEDYIRNMGVSIIFS